MSVQLRQYTREPGFTKDYCDVRAFLVNLANPNYPFGRWDWMITHGMLDKSGLSRIGIWERDGDIVAIATYDCRLGSAYLCCLPAYRFLLRDMLLYAERHLASDKGFRAIIPDTDGELQQIAASEGFMATQAKESDAVFPLDDPKAITYSLPDGFRVTSMAETYDYLKYRHALWEGFGHEGELRLTAEELKEGEREMIRPNVNLELKIAVVAPNGDFVSYCGMWYDPHCAFALVEPVATRPAYRRMGLGRAAVLEGVKRCGLLGAKKAVVGSSQQFYYSIGFRPFATSTFWERKRPGE